MNILMDADKSYPVAIVLDKKEAGMLVEIMAAALLNKPLNKRSNAYKLAKKIDDDLPIY